jgi:azurin
VVRAVIARTTALSPDERATPDAIDAMGVAERLAGALPADRARALRAELRALGVRVVRIEALPEQVAFDLRWFVVEAGKPVQIVFFNPDAMPHNVVVGAPGSLELIGTKGGEMPVPTDPLVKPFVPDLPQVLHATRLVTQGQTERLGFIAPADPGEYVFVCTFPGHWVRMYGVMLVVPNLEAWEASPRVPIDPMTKQPFS